jgi:hypothetical protein
MFVHLKKDLNVEPVNWITCNEPPDPDAKFAAATPGDMTGYGLRKEVQKKLAAIRTDLDSFSDLEAYALMTSGYRMTEREFSGYIKKFLPGSEERVNWRFLEIDQAITAAPGHESEYRHLMKILEVAASKGFKVWKLQPWLQVFGALAGAGVLGLLYAAWSFSLITVGGTIKAVIAAALIIIAGSVVAKMFNCKKTLSEIGIGIGTALFGFVAARLHLRYFDPLYLKLGRMSSTEKDP